MAIEPSDELIWKYLTGQCDAAEISFLENWLNSNPEHLKKLDRIRLYQSLQQKDINQAGKDELHQEPDEYEKSFSKYHLAAVLILIVFVLLVLFKYLSGKG